MDEEEPGAVGEDAEARRDVAGLGVERTLEPAFAQDRSERVLLGRGHLGGIRVGSEAGPLVERPLVRLPHRVGQGQDRRHRLERRRSQAAPVGNRIRPESRVRQEGLGVDERLESVVVPRAGCREDRSMGLRDRVGNVLDGRNRVRGRDGGRRGLGTWLGGGRGHRGRVVAAARRHRGEQRDREHSGHPASQHPRSFAQPEGSTGALSCRSRGRGGRACAARGRGGPAGGRPRRAGSASAGSPRSATAPAGRAPASSGRSACA